MCSIIIIAEAVLFYTVINIQKSILAIKSTMQVTYIRRTLKIRFNPAGFALPSVERSGVQPEKSIIIK